MAYGPVQVHYGGNGFPRRLDQRNLLQPIQGRAQCPQATSRDEAKSAAAGLIMIVAEQADQRDLQVVNATLAATLDCVPSKLYSAHDAALTATCATMASSSVLKKTRITHSRNACCGKP